YGGTKRCEAALARAFGAEEVARTTALQTKTLQALRAFCHDRGLGDQVQGVGEFLIGHSPRATAAIQAKDWGEPVAPSGQPDIARHGGVLIRPCFGIHPLRLVRAMAEATEDAGAAIHPRSEVHTWERQGNGHRLLTTAGALRATRVVVAGGAFTPERLHPQLGQRVVPVISNIAVTRVLTTEERARHPWLGADPAADTRHMLAYFRLLPENRLLFGMRGDARGSAKGASAMLSRLKTRLAAALPGLAEAEIEYFWRGPVCTTATLRPALGALTDEPTVYHGFGWHGSGIAMGTLAGRLLGEQIAGAPPEAIPAPWRGLPPRLPLPGLRPLYVRTAFAGYALADRLS
ncbi:MAG: FAD-binding oxidoreductase, partial [Pseudomonadota bacterium]